MQQSVNARGRFLAEVHCYSVGQFVWVDEADSDRRDQMRKFGYSLKGEPPVYHRILH